MSTTGIQNYLSNVFRQVYTYDSTAALFTPKLELSNIDTYSGNSVSVATMAVGDAASNVYVGSNAGNPYNFIQNDRNVTAVGFGAAGGISNVSNSVYLGFRAGVGAADANAIIAIGASAIGGGTSNISIGNGTGTVGSSNILIGHSIAPGVVSNQLRIGMSNNTVIAGNFASNWVGIGGVLNPVNSNTKLDVSGNTRIQGSLGVFMPPGDRTLDVNGSFRANNGLANLELNGAVVSATRNGGTMSVKDSIFGTGMFEATGPSGALLQVSTGTVRAAAGTAIMMANVTGLGDSISFEVGDPQRVFARFADIGGVGDVRFNIPNGAFTISRFNPTGSFVFDASGTAATIQNDNTGSRTKMAVEPQRFYAEDENGSRLELSNGVTRSTNGYTSLRGVTVSTASTVLVIPIGVTLISAATGSGTTIHAVGMYFLPSFGNTSYQINYYSSSPSFLSFSATVNGIAMDAASNTRYTLTYFPLP
jgi:hypothetical protein